jgi:hypothetical protein
MALGFIQQIVEVSDGHDINGNYFYLALWLWILSWMD